LKVVNYSSGEYLARGERLDGRSLITQFIDWSAENHDVLYAVAGPQQNANWPAGKDEYTG